MTKSAIILLILLWLLCTIYLNIARAYNYPYQLLALVGAWTASALLLVCIVVFVKQHRDRKKNQQ